MPTYTHKWETLQYVTNLSQETIAKMAHIRKKFVELAAEVEALGSSRETASAFTFLEQAQSATIKHLCLTDAQAVFAPLGE